MELNGERIRLRELTPEDHADIHAYASDPEVTRFATFGPNTVEETTQHLDEVARQQLEVPRRTFTLGLTRHDDDQVIGSAELTVDGSPHRRGELGYVIRRDQWGQGYATEATRLLLDLGFGPLGLHRISATCRPNNLASAAVLRKVGMTQEGQLRDHMFLRGEWRDSLLFAILAPDS